MPHIHEKYDFIVNCYIVFNHKVLLVNHPRYGMWLCPGGHVELDEDPEEALFREIKEETGLDVEIIAQKPSAPGSDSKFLYIPAYISVHNANPQHKHIAISYFGIAKNGDYQKSDEHTDAKWFCLDDLDNPNFQLNAEIKFFAKQAINTALA